MHMYCSFQVVTVSFFSYTWSTELFGTFRFSKLNYVNCAISCSCNRVEMICAVAVDAKLLSPLVVFQNPLKAVVVDSFAKLHKLSPAKLGNNIFPLSYKTKQ